MIQDHKAVIIHLLMTVTPPKIQRQGQTVVMVRGGSRAWPWVNKLWLIFQIKTINVNVISRHVLKIRSNSEKMTIAEPIGDPLNPPLIAT